MTTIVFTLVNPKEGSRYMCRMLHGSTSKMNAIPNSYIQWEPDSSVANATTLYQFNQGDTIRMDGSWEVKLKRIKERVKTGFQLYFDSDFRFAMVWADYAVRDIKDFKIVNMYRSPALIARSLCWHGFYTSKEDHAYGQGGGWLFQPEHSGNLTILENLEEATPADKCIWHTFEVNERKKKFLRENPHISVFDFDLENDRNEETFLRLFDFLGVEKNDRVLSIVDSDPVINSWMGKHPIVFEITTEEVEEKVANYEVKLR